MPTLTDIEKAQLDVVLKGLVEKLKELKPFSDYTFGGSLIWDKLPDPVKVEMETILNKADNACMYGSDSLDLNNCPELDLILNATDELLMAGDQTGEVYGVKTGVDIVDHIQKDDLVHQVFVEKLGREVSSIKDMRIYFVANGLSMQLLRRVLLNRVCGLMITAIHKTSSSQTLLALTRLCSWESIKVVSKDSGARAKLQLNSAAHQDRNCHEILIAAPSLKWLEQGSTTHVLFGHLCELITLIIDYLAPEVVRGQTFSERDAHLRRTWLSAFPGGMSGSIPKHALINFYVDNLVFHAFQDMEGGWKSCICYEHLM